VQSTEFQRTKASLVLRNFLLHSSMAKEVAFVRGALGESGPAQTGTTRNSAVIFFFMPICQLGMAELQR
ncbi:MAG: hypothetical protein Q4D50_07685, partial [Eubacteriales bacterium]|nr:hypothetical protein [Eubacteriales bacterium]